MNMFLQTIGVGLTMVSGSFSSLSSFSSREARCSFMTGEGDGQLATLIDPDNDFLLLTLEIEFSVFNASKVTINMS